MHVFPFSDNEFNVAFTPFDHAFYYERVLPTITIKDSDVATAASDIKSLTLADTSASADASSSTTTVTAEKVTIGGGGTFEQVNGEMRPLAEALYIYNIPQQYDAVGNFVLSVDPDEVVNTIILGSEKLVQFPIYGGFGKHEGKVVACPFVNMTTPLFNNPQQTLSLVLNVKTPVSSTSKPVTFSYCGVTMGEKERAEFRSATEKREWYCVPCDLKGNYLVYSYKKLQFLPRKGAKIEPPKPVADSGDGDTSPKTPALLEQTAQQ